MGVINKNKHVVVFTSTNNDFKISVVTNLRPKITSMKDPVLLVIKKNTATLKNLRKWLELHNAVNDKIDSSVLLIDDEADNASINHINPKHQQLLTNTLENCYLFLPRQII